MVSRCLLQWALMIHMFQVLEVPIWTQLQMRKSRFLPEDAGSPRGTWQLLSSRSTCNGLEERPGQFLERAADCFARLGMLPTTFLGQGWCKALAPPQGESWMQRLVFWNRSGGTRCCRMILILSELWERLQTLGSALYNRDSNSSFIELRRTLESAAHMPGWYWKSFDFLWNIPYTNLQLNSWLDRCLPGSEGNCLTGWKWQGSDSTRTRRSEHVPIRDRRFWRRWKFKQGLCYYRRRGARARSFFAFCCTQLLSGLYQSWFGISATSDTRLGPKSEPCVSRGGRHRVATSMLWFLIQMSMLESAGGVKVVHSHPMCTGAVTGFFPAAANHGGISYAVEPPNFPKARKRAYMRALQRASASSNGGTWYRSRFLTLQQLQGHQRPAATGRSLRDENVQAGSSRLRVVVWNCGGLHSERYQEFLCGCTSKRYCRSLLMSWFWWRLLGKKTWSL